ncbi:MAG: Mur ligase family protein [Treponema sp.]|nr:Mur ligase family protein [Treponema sp.]
MAFIAVLIFLFLFLTELALLGAARKRFSLVIHVNGTRGKSTLTRMIHALLASQGLDVYGKTTGSAARLLLPDGSEQTIGRLGPANVREQRNMMLYSAFTGTSRRRALVFECNAIQGELQQISSRWLRPDITVITNVRPDHVRELGSPEETAKTFAAATPRGSVLISSEARYRGTWERAARERALEFRFVDPQEAPAGDFPENRACIMALADHLKMDRAAALEAIRSFKPDAGAFRIHSWPLPRPPAGKAVDEGSGEGSISFADARAANDTESTKQLYQTALDRTSQTRPWRILLLTSRQDRPDRTWEFMHFIMEIHREEPFDQYLCLGPAPLSFYLRLKRRGIKVQALKGLEDLDCFIARWAGENPGRDLLILAAGNYGGPALPLSRWLQDKTRGPL